MPLRLTSPPPPPSLMSHLLILFFRSITLLGAHLSYSQLKKNIVAHTTIPLSVSTSVHVCPSMYDTLTFNSAYRIANYLEDFKQKNRQTNSYQYIQIATCAYKTVYLSQVCYFCMVLKNSKKRFKS